MSGQMQEAAQQFRAHCLLDDDSVFFPGEPVWTIANLKRLRKVFIEDFDGGKRTFWEKYEDQLRDEESDVQRLGVEVLAIYYLFPDTVRPDTKRRRVGQVLGWSGATLPEDNPVTKAFDFGLINPGQGYNTRRPSEMGFLIDFVLAWKNLPASQREELLAGEPWDFQTILDEVEHSESRQMRHILLALLFPDYYEAIASNDHKKAIASTFAGLLSAEEQEFDRERQLHLIRNRLTEYLPARDITYYEAPLVGAWRGIENGGADDTVPLDIVEYKKQVIFYGPPGTGKTFQAKALAASIIRASALAVWGAPEFFANQDRVEEAVEANTHRQQLHPSYSYEQFIRALHIDATGATVFRNGFLLDVIEAMDESASQPGGRLPHVVILDEINRTDLSRMLGECFSLLEDREESIELAGRNEDGSKVSLRIPDDLYIIGTMNLIDQSVEQIDFALRRRFLWIASNFDAEAFVSIAQRRWGALGSRLSWDKIAGDFRRLAQAGAGLNERIHKSPLLGAQYEVGHTYLLDIVDFLNDALGPNPSRRRTFLYDGSNNPIEPMRRLWRLSLRPLMEQYLSGLDGPDRDRELTSLGDIFLARREPIDDEG